MFKKVLLGVLSSSFGLGIGLGVAVVYGRTVQDTAPAAHESPERRSTARAAEKYDVDPLLVRRMVRSELQANSLSPAPTSAPGPAEDESVEPYPPQETFEEVQARIRAEVADHRAWFDSEAVDRSWAPRVTESFTTSLLEMPDTSYQLVEITCKTSVCMGKLEWESAATAVRELPKIAEHRYESNCATGIYLPDLEKTGNEGPIRGDVVFDCTELRAGTL